MAASAFACLIGRVYLWRNIKAGKEWKRNRNDKLQCRTNRTASDRSTGLRENRVLEGRGERRPRRDETLDRPSAGHKLRRKRGENDEKGSNGRRRQASVRVHAGRGSVRPNFGLVGRMMVQVSGACRQGCQSSNVKRSSVCHPHRYEQGRTLESEAGPLGAVLATGESHAGNRLLRERGGQR